MLLLSGAMLMAGAFAPAIGHATSLATGTRSLAAAKATVARCDPDGFTVVPNLSGANVVSVDVGGIAASCGGGALQLTFDNGTSRSPGSLTVPASGGSVTVTLSSAVAVSGTERIDVVIAGP
jgi:hypothetical protein